MGKKNLLYRGSACKMSSESDPDEIFEDAQEPADSLDMSVSFAG